MGQPSWRRQTYLALESINCIGRSKHAAKIEQACKPGQPVTGVYSYGYYNTIFDRAMTVTHWIADHYPVVRLWREVDYEMMAEFLAEKQATCTPDALRTYLSTLRKLQEGLWVCDFIRADVVPPWTVAGQNPPRGPYLEAEACDLQVRVAARHESYGQALNFILATGARISETHHLRTDKISVADGCVELLGKGGRVRTVPLLDPGILGKLDLTRPFVFLDKESDPHWKDNLERQVRQACDDLNFQRRGVHGLRATAAGVFLQRQMDLGLTEPRARRELAVWLGHSPHRTEVTYAYVPKTK